MDLRNTNFVRSDDMWFTACCKSMEYKNRINNNCEGWCNRMVTKKFRIFQIPKKDNDLLEQAYHLRYQVFIDELGWLDSNNYDEPREYDEYDSLAVDFGVTVDEGELIAYSRVIFSPHPFMLEKDFSNLIEGITLDKKDTCEISRLVVSSKYRGWNTANPAISLYKKMLNWEFGRDVAFAYCVIETKHKRLLQRAGAHFRQLGNVHQYQDGVKVCAIEIDVALSRKSWKFNEAVF